MSRAAKWPFLTIAAFVLLALASPAPAETTVIYAGRLIVDASKSPLGPSTILIRNGKIASVTLGRMPAPAEAKIIDLASKTVLPGLVDAHVHLQYDPDFDETEQRHTEEFVVALGMRNALRTARAGFTTVRNVGGQTLADLAIRDAVRAGVGPGPRILTSGREFSATGGAGDTTVGLPPEVADALNAYRPQRTLCAGADGCAEAVRRAVRSGVDVIKVYATGAVMDNVTTGLDQQLSDAELTSIVETAHRLGIKVAAHAHGPNGIIAAVRAGVDSIEHGTFADPRGIDLMRQRHTFLVPTLTVASNVEQQIAEGRLPPAKIDKARAVMAHLGKALAAAYRAGVPIALGTDAGVFPHGLNGRELELMVRLGGMTPRDALIAATKGGAELLGLKDSIGTLDPGKSADLIAVDGNPLEDPRAVLNIRYVMVMGKAIPLE